MQNNKSGDHVSDELLEEYARGSMVVSQASVVSEHLFECDICNQKLEEEIQFRIAMRTAASQKVAQEPVSHRWWKPLFAPVPLLSAAVALVFFAFFLPRITQTGPPVVAELAALRGNQSAEVPAGRRLELRLAGSGTEEMKGIRVEIVSQDGGRVWNGGASLQGQFWRVETEKGFPAGQYWVRLYGPNQTADSPLREYALKLK